MAKRVLLVGKQVFWINFGWWLFSKKIFFSLRFTPFIISFVFDVMKLHIKFFNHYTVQKLWLNIGNCTTDKDRQIDR